MCFIERIDYVMWINLDGFDQKLILKLKRHPSGRGYNDFFTIEQPLGGGQGSEMLFVLPFRDVTNVTYSTSGPSGDCLIGFEMAGDDRFKEIRVARHCFNLFAVRKMISIYRKGRRKAML